MFNLNLYHKGFNHPTLRHLYQVLQRILVYNRVLDDTITFSLSNFEEPLSFNRGIFSSVIGLDYTKDFVSLPPHEAVKDALATLGLADDKRPTMTSVALAHSSPLRIRYFSPTWKVLMVYIVKCLGRNHRSHDQLNVNQQMIAYALCWGLNINIAGIVFNDLVANLSSGGKKGKEKNISEVPIPSHMRRVSKLPKKPLILPSEEMNAEDSNDKSLSGTVVHPDSKPKAKTYKKRRTKNIPSSSEPNASKIIRIQSPTTQAFKCQPAEEPEVIADATTSLEASKSAEDQDNQSHIVDAEKVQENIVKEAEHNAEEQHDDDEFVDSGLQTIGDISLESLNKPADESPYDTKSEIKFVKRFKPLVDDDEPHITFIGSMKLGMEEDFDMASMPDDDVGSLYGSHTSDNEDADSQHQHKELFKSEERDADRVIDEQIELNASADKPLDPLGHLQSKITSRSTKVGQLESNITKKVSEELQNFVPTLIIKTLKQHLPGLLSDTLKTSLLLLLKDLIKESVATSIEEKLPLFDT
ncbi:hypothetical protein Tco_0736032 [Tanacetum coccineum]